MNLLSALRLTLNPAQPDVVALTGGGGKTSTLFRLADEIAAAGKRVITTTTTRIFAEQVDQSPVHLPVPDGIIDWQRLETLLAKHGQCLLVTALDGPKMVGVAPAVVDALASRAADLGIAAILIEADGSRRRPVKAPAAHEPVIPDSTTLVVPILGLDAVGVRLDETHVHRPEFVRAVLGIDDPMLRLTPAMAAYLLVHPNGGGKGRPSTARLLPLLNKAESAPRLATGRLIAQRLARQGQASLIGTVGMGERSPIRERWGPTSAVILAAGESRRMGEAKQLLQLGGEALVTRAARLALESRASEVIVMTGAHADRVSAALQVIGNSRLHIVHNPDWVAGQSTSVRAAVAALAAESMAVMFLPVDQPAVPVSLLRRGWRLWRSGADLVAPCVDGEIRGAPAIFDRQTWPQLQTLTGDRGAGGLLKQGATVATLDTPASWLEDVDTPAAWQRFLERNSEMTPP